MPNHNNDKKESEINLLEIGLKLWNKKRIIIKCSILGGIIGAIISFSLPNEYLTTIVLKTESSKSIAGNMGALASMAGVNIGDAIDQDILSPEIYPEILNSTPFVQGLLNINVIDEDQNINTTLFNYLKNNQKEPWWNYILKLPETLVQNLSSKNKIENDNFQLRDRYISEEELRLIEKVTSSYSISTNKKNGLITIEVISQSPVISAFLADTITSYLQFVIINERTKKAKMDLANSEKLYEESKNNYYKSQEILASFADANLNIISAKYRINEEKLQNEANLAYSTYNQMAEQVQNNKIKIQDNTPVFTIIQPAIEPIYPEKPKKKLIVIILCFLGFITSSLWILKKDIKLLIIN